MTLQPETIAQHCLFHTEGKAFCACLPWQDALGTKEISTCQHPAWFIWTGNAWRQHPLRNANWWLDDWWRHCPDPLQRIFLQSRRQAVRKAFTAMLTIPFPLLAADPGFPVVDVPDNSAVIGWRHDWCFVYNHAPAYAAAEFGAGEMEEVLSDARSWAAQCVTEESGCFSTVEDILASLREWLVLFRPDIHVSDRALQRLLPWVLNSKQKNIAADTGYAAKVSRPANLHRVTQRTGTHAF